MKPSLLTAILWLLLSTVASAQQVAKSLTAANGQFIGFYEFKPAAYATNPTAKFPLIIFMHGIGERGNGTTELNRVLANGIPKYINNGHPMTFTWDGSQHSFLVLSPQLSSSLGFWYTFHVEEMIKYAKQNLRVDTNRIIVTGLSLGGGGVWTYASSNATNANTAAAIVPVCGTCAITDASIIANGSLPIWGFHANNDGTVAVGCTAGGISSINSYGPAVTPLMTIYPDGGHGIWDRAYDYNYTWQNPNVYEWMLNQNRSLPINQLPVANAGPNLTISTSKAFVNLSGTASTDPDGRIVRYVWRKVSGPAAGSIVTPVSSNGLTTVTNLTLAGTYVYEVKAIDNRAGWSVSTVTVTVVSGSAANINPVAIAGSDITTTSTTINLNGGNSYDPDGNSVTYAWSKVSGPGTYAISNGTSSVPTIYNLSNGTYEFELVTTDNLGAIDRDTVVVYENFVILPEFFRTSAVRSSLDKVSLFWSIAQENEGSVYTIERSTDGKTFIATGTVKGQAGGAAQYAYEFIDQPGAGLYYYRIRLTSPGAQALYSSLMSVVVNGKEGGMQLFPNPARNEVKLLLPSNTGNELQLRMMNSEGKQVFSRRITPSEADKLITIPVQHLLPGIYLVMVSDERNRIGVKKLVKN